MVGYQFEPNRCLWKESVPPGQYRTELSLPAELWQSKRQDKAQLVQAACRVLPWLGLEEALQRVAAEEPEAAPART